MRIAVVSDIHGNLIALDAVLADARALGAEEYVFIGDYCAIGPEPAAVLERLCRLDRAVFTRGNTDRYVATGERPPPTLEAVERDPSLIPRYAGIAASMAWTRGYLAATGWLGWLDELPLETRFSAPSGLRILAVHAAPGTDDGEGVHPGRGDAELRALVEEIDDELVLVGHTHEPMVRRVDGRSVVNVGSVGNPRAPDLRASYALLELDPTGVRLQHRRVPYDHAAFIDVVRGSRHPAAEFILSFQRGEHPAKPPHADHAAHVSGAWAAISGE